MVNCGSTAPVHRLAVSTCSRRRGPHGDAAEEGVRHAQQVWPALHYAGHNVRQRCPLRHRCAAPAQAIMLREEKSSTRGRQRYGSPDYLYQCAVMSFLVLLCERGGKSRR